MDIIQFDTLLFEIAGRVKSIKSKSKSNQALVFIVENDLSNLVSAYVVVRTYLYLKGIGNSQKAKLRTVEDFNRLLAQQKIDKSISIGELCEKFKSAAIILNTFIANFAEHEPIEILERSNLAKGLFVPLIILQERYRQVVYTILNDFKPSQKGINFCIVGSQALTLLLFTLIKNREEGKDLYKILNSRDLDLRLTVPYNIKSVQFLEYSNKLKKIFFGMYEGIIEHSNLEQRYCTCTLNSGDLKIDIVLTCGAPVFSNYSVAIPVVDAISKRFIEPSFFSDLACRQVKIPNLESLIKNGDKYALAFIKKHLEFLSTIKNIQLVTEQKVIWDKINPTLSAQIVDIYNSKYTKTPSSIPHVLAAVLVPVEPTERKASACRFDIEQFPLLGGGETRPRKTRTRIAKITSAPDIGQTKSLRPQ